MADTLNLEAAKRMYRSWHHAQANRCTIGPWESLTDQQRLEWLEKARRASPAAAVPEGALTRQTYHWNGLELVTVEAAKEYARAAVEADRAQQGEPVYQFSTGKDSWLDCDKTFYDNCLKYNYARRIVYLAATKAAAPADAPVVRPLDDPKMAEYLSGQPLISAYIETLECELRKATRAAPSPDTGIPELPAELFDGHAVYSEITRHLGKAHCHSPDTVSATLDALARLMRSGRAPVSGTPTSGEVEKAGPTVPDGYVLLPEAPTNAMICAIENAIDGQLVASAMDPRQMFRQDGERIYEALLEAVAAPSHPSEAKAGEDA